MTIVELEGKTVLVTGAARGIGRGIAEAFAREGANVVVADLGALADEAAGDWNYALSAEAALATAAEEIGELGGDCVAVAVDVADGASCQNLVDKALEAFGRLDVIVNNAGLIQTGPLVDFAERDWDRIFAVNVKGIFLLSRAALPTMRASGGAIINIASVAGKRGFPDMGAYCASKFAAIGLTQSMAAELAADGIRVNAICPGNVDTSMWFDHLSKSRRHRRRFGTDTVDATFDAVVEANIPLGREQKPHDMAEAALYLARAENVTGVSLVVAGGFVMN